MSTLRKGLFHVRRVSNYNRYRSYIWPIDPVDPSQAVMEEHRLFLNAGLGFWSETPQGQDGYLSNLRGEWPYYDAFDGMTDHEVDTYNEDVPLNAYIAGYFQIDTPQYTTPGQYVPVSQWFKYNSGWITACSYASIWRGWNTPNWDYSRDIAPGVKQYMETYRMGIFYGEWVNAGSAISPCTVGHIFDFLEPFTIGPSLPSL